jgi:CheY-like chemotaxis protein
MARILLIEDTEIHAVHARRRLVKAGLDVTLCRQAREGIETAKHLLNRACAPQLQLIILDWFLPHPQSPSLEGIVVAAELIRCMDAQTIHPAHIVVLTQDPSRERRADALTIGCTQVLDKPLSVEAVQELLVLIQTPPTYPLIEPGYRRLLRFVQPTLEMLYAGAESTGALYWTRKSVKKLMDASSMYDMSREERRWLEECGGFVQVKNFINTVDLADDRLTKLRTLLILHPEAGWEWLMRAMGTNKNYIYDYKNMLFDTLADRLNTLKQSPELTAFQSS